MDNASMMTAHEKVSVIIPTYNREHLLGRAVESVIRQRYPHIELIIVDDQSTDNTAATAERLRAEYPSVIYCLNCRRKGPSGARNTGILKASGDWLAFLDSDDEWLPDHLSEALAFLRTNRTATVMFGNFSVVEADSGTHLYEFFEKKDVLKKLKKIDLQRGFCLLQDNIFEALVRENFFHLGSSLIRRCMAAGILFDEKIRFAEDRDFAIRLFKEAGAVFGCRLNSTFTQYRHAGNLTEFRDTDVLSEDYRAQLYLFEKYLGEYHLSRSERKIVFETMQKTLVKLSYRCRRKAEWIDSWRYLSRSFKYGISRRQLEECVKLLLAAITGLRNAESIQ